MGNAGFEEKKPFNKDAVFQLLANGKKEDILNYDLRGADLSRADLSDINMEGVDLKNANLSNANLTNAYLPNANLQGTNLKSAFLQAAALEGADLSGANLEGADFTYSDLREVNFANANLEGADFVYTKLTNEDLPLREQDYNYIVREKAKQQTENHNQQIEAAKKAGYIQGVCECVTAISSDKLLGKQLFSEMKVTKEMAKQYANPETYKALVASIFTPKQEHKQEQQQSTGRRR